MKRAILLPVGLLLLLGCHKGATPADKTAVAILDANQKSCDPLADGIFTAYQQATSAGTPPDDAVRAFVAGPGAEPAAEVQAGLPFADKAVRPAAAEEGEVRNLLVDWQTRQAQFCGLAAGTPTGDNLKTFVADHDRVMKAIRESREKLGSLVPLTPEERTSLTQDWNLNVRAAAKEKLGELAAQAQMAAQRAARVAAEAAEAQQLAAEDQAREDEKKRLKAQEEEDKEALNRERRAAEEMEVRMKRERQEKTMRERQAQGVAMASAQLRSWAATYRQQIAPFARTVRTAQRPSASDICPLLLHATDGVRIPQAPDPNLQEHLSEALRLVSAAAESCGQKLKDTTAYRLQLVMEHLSAIDSQLPGGG